MSLSIHAVSRPLYQQELVPRDEMIEPTKAKYEGASEEINIVLGRVYSTRTLCVSLPGPKFIAWTKTIQDILSKDGTNANNFELLIGRLNHKASIIPLERHLFTRIRYFKLKINAFSRYLLWTNICNDLKLHMKISQNYQ